MSSVVKSANLVEYAETTPAEQEAMKRHLAPIRNNIATVAIMPSHGFDAPLPLLQTTQHYGAGAVLPRGMVLNVDGNLAVTGPPTVGEAADAEATIDSNMHLVFNERSGLGVSSYRITTPDLTLATLNERFDRAKKDKSLPSIGDSTPTHHISITKFNRSGTDEFAIVVRANDAPAAVKLMEDISAAPTPPTVGQLEESPQYRSLLDSSQRYRNLLADQTAAALGVSIDKTPLASSTTHSIVRVGSSNRYNVYHDAINTERANAGGIIVSSGTTGSYMHMTTKSQSGWSNAHLSSVPASTGAHNPAVHKFDPIAFKTERVHFESNLPGVQHPQTGHTTADHTEPAVVAVLNKATDSRPLETTTHHFVAGVVPNASTLGHLPTASLLAMTKSTTAKSVQVPVDSAVVREITSNWNVLKSKMPAGYTLPKALSSEFSYENDPILTELSSVPALRDAATVPATVQTGPPFRFGVGPFRPRRYRRGRGVGLGLDLALLTTLGLLGGVARPNYYYEPPYYYRRPPPYYY